MNNNYNNGDCQQPMQPPHGQKNVQSVQQMNQPTVMLPIVNVDVKAYRLATASLAIGIVGLFFFWAPVVPIVLSIISLVLSGKARRVIPRGAPGRGMAKAGTVISIIGIVLGSICLLIYINNYFNVPSDDFGYYDW